MSVPLPPQLATHPPNGAHGVTRPTLALLVDDADVVYPMRIDPRFSDANWISMGGVRGANSQVNAAVVDGSDNLYIGGYFTIVGDTFANYIAKWDGNSWSALGSGLNDTVNALAVSGSDLYAGGSFTKAGGKVSTYVARAIIGDATWLPMQFGVPGPNTNTLTFTGIARLVSVSEEIWKTSRPSRQVVR